ncbi:protein kinase C-like [Cephus cinctus]|uniref:Protein kinase C-like n=1 Tax=Cephus cinctus TaxID=211228 RepID=A0AAJ7CCH3_CEPCN|nr:protein kinase C-like [Cephus cinctus]
MNMQTGNYTGGSITEESVNKITEGMNQNCIIARRKDEYPENGGRVINNGQALPKPGVPRSILQDFPMKNISQKTPPNKGYGNYDKVKEQNTLNRDAIRNNKNGTGSRFKKNLDGRYRNSYQQSPYQQQTQHQQQQQPQQQAPYQQTNGCVETPPPVQPGRNDLVQGQRPSPQQAGHSFGNPSTYQSPYSTQQTMYAPVPYYSGESESYGHSYYASNTGYFSVPYVSRSDIPDGNNVNAYPPNVYSNVDNYPATSFCEVYPQYVYPQQNMYPGVPQQPPQENWYPLPGQAQYVQYAALPSPISASSSSSISATPPNISSDL